VGWHQDQNYWVDLWEGEVFTLWLALDAVDADMGPLRFVKGSHRWGHRTDGDFFSQDLDSGRARMTPGGETWSEVPALLPAGGASVHHKLTVHGSTQNTSQRTRYGMALHLRTDRSNPVAGVEDPLVALASDESLSPVLYGAA
jgi:ectoine hydroxylase-related dioxygenase (phytanoyl-CoA dioxygenase family)